MTQPAAALRSCEVDMHPGDIRSDEAAQEAGGVDVITLALGRALQDIGDHALEVAVVIIIHWKAPYPLAALSPGALQRVAPRHAIGEHAAVTLRERVDARAR